MKYVVAVLLLGLCSTGFVSARSRHVLRNEAEPELPDFTNLMQCSDKLQACHNANLQQFQAEPGENPIAKFRDAGARQFCRVSAEAHLCVAEALEESYCQDLPDFILALNTKGVELTENVCVTKINDLEKHWNCLLSDTVHQNLYQCGRNLMDCNNIEPVVDCVAGLLANSPDCKSGAEEFVRDVLPQTLRNIGFCDHIDGPSHKRALMKFLKI